MKENHYYAYATEILVLEVIRQLVIKFNLPYDEVETQFKESTTYHLLLKKLKLEIWQKNTYSEQATLILDIYLQEQEMNKKKEIFFNNLKDKDQKETEFKNLKAFAITNEITMEEAYHLLKSPNNQNQTSNLIKQRKYQI